jgi:hypothetical protein
MSTTDPSLDMATPELAYGSVWLVSAGDGDPRHLPPLATCALAAADAVIHDPGIPQRVLDLVEPVFYREPAAFEQAIKRSIMFARPGWCVVRLVESNAMEHAVERARFAEYRIPLEVVRGAGELLSAGAPHESPMETSMALADLCADTSTLSSAHELITRSPERRTQTRKDDDNDARSRRIVKLGKTAMPRKPSGERALNLLALNGVGLPLEAVWRPERRQETMVRRQAPRGALLRLLPGPMVRRLRSKYRQLSLGRWRNGGRWFRALSISLLSSTRLLGTLLALSVPIDNRLPLRRVVRDPATLDEHTLRDIGLDRMHLRYGRGRGFLQNHL